MKHDIALSLSLSASQSQSMLATATATATDCCIHIFLMIDTAGRIAEAGETGGGRGTRGSSEQQLTKLICGKIMPEI